MKILEGDKDRLLQTERTRRGMCARCGQDVNHHAKGNCSDGRGSFTWAHTRQGMKRLISNLEAFVAAAKGN